MRNKGEKGMDLTEARRIGGRPQAYRARLWERALRILMRWAKEPCVQREYDKRIGLCRKVYRAIQDWMAELEKERNKRWKFKASVNKEPGAKVGAFLRLLNGKADSASVSKVTARTSPKKKTSASPATRRAKRHGKTSATSQA
jgi:hypothetical protein